MPASSDSTLRPTPRAMAAWALAIVMLLALRVPSLVEPAGGDQGLYGYAGQQILDGAVPDRDVWDQKPPGIQFLYAAFWRVWPHESLVPGSDLLVAAMTAALLVAISIRRASFTTGALAAVLFLFLGDPWMQRNAGVYVRGQCEPFIALAVTKALWLLASRSRGRAHLIGAGLCLAVAFWLKYNALAYALPMAVALWAWPAHGTSSGISSRRFTAAVGDLVWVGATFAAAVAAVLAYFAWHHALDDLYLATITYNLQYSGETYRGLGHVLAYPFLLPVARARVDLLWFLGGLGAIALIVRLRTNRVALVVLGWLVAAIVSIAVNGGREEPNYFVQANPALALAAAAGLAVLAAGPRWLRAALAIVLVAAVARVGDEPRAIRFAGVPGLVDNFRFDLAHARGHIDRTTYLARFAGEKFNALEIDNLSRFVDEVTRPSDPIYVFGFSGGSVCWKSERTSASRFFWSRPILIDFAADRPGYGSAGLLADLVKRPPALVALQKEEWQSETFFMSHDALRHWLETGYVLDHQTPMFDVWRARTPRPADPGRSSSIP